MASILLGRAQLQIKSGNLLSNAFHPHYGWVWTDGYAVFLLTSSEDGVIEDAATSQKLGEYGEVRRVLWSHHSDQNSSRWYLAVQESKLVTIWEVFGKRQNPEFKVIKKIDGISDLRDIIWHPVYPILCMVSSSGSSLYYLDSDWSVQLSQDPNTAGCWTLDGKTLVLAAEGNLSIYKWAEDINRHEGHWTTKRLTIERFKGKVGCIVAVSSQHLTLTTDLPLVEVISRSNQDTFEPLIINSIPTTNRTLITEISGTSVGDVATNITKETISTVEKLEEPCRVRSTNVVDSLKDEIMRRTTGPVDLTAMLSVFAAKKVDEKETQSANFCESIGIELLDEHHDLKADTNKKIEDILSKKDETNVNKCKEDDGGSIGRKPLVGASPLFTLETFLKKEELSVERGHGWNVYAGGSTSSLSSVPVFKIVEKLDLEDSAHIHLLDVSSDEPTIMSSSKVPGMISPDLVTFESRSNSLYVGSRSNQYLQVFQVKNGLLKTAERIVGLNDQERPVGIQCGLHEHAIFMLVSKPATRSVDVTFPMTTGTQQVDLYLKQIDLCQA